MVDFSELFMETDKIEYNGKTLIMLDRIPVNSSFKAEIELISTNSQFRQAISFKTEGNIDVGEGLVGPEHIFWEELWTELGHKSIEINGNSTNGELLIWNEWWQDDHVEAWTRNAAMVKEEISCCEFIYHCNDGQWDYDFDDIVFRIRIIEGAKIENDKV